MISRFKLFTALYIGISKKTKIDVSGKKRKNRKIKAFFSGKVY